MMQAYKSHKDLFQEQEKEIL